MTHVHMHMLRILMWNKRIYKSGSQMATYAKKRDHTYTLRNIKGNANMSDAGHHCDIQAEGP